MLLDFKNSYQPLVFKGVDNIYDFGLNFSFVEEKAGIMTIYHSTKNISGDLNVKVSNASNILAAYTSTTSAMSNYNADSFELGIKANIERR